MTFVYVKNPDFLKVALAGIMLAAGASLELQEVNVRCDDVRAVGTLSASEAPLIASVDGIGGSGIWLHSRTWTIHVYPDDSVTDQSRSNAVYC